MKLNIKPIVEDINLILFNYFPVSLEEMKDINLFLNKIEVKING